MEEKNNYEKEDMDKIEALEVAELEERVQSLRKDDSQLIQITDYVIRKGINQLEKEGPFAYFKSSFPSLIVVILSFLVDVAYVPLFGHVANSFSQWLFPEAPTLNTQIEPIQLWWMPFVFYLIFIVFALRANQTLKAEIISKGASEEIISKVNEKYNGLVDSIGTALPLLGAAILLVSIKIGPQLFLGFSVPFEIKSIIILAVAKLFGAVFEAQSLRFQKIVEEVKNVEAEFEYQTRERMQENLIVRLSDANRKVLTDLMMASGTGVKHFSKEEIEYIYKLIKVTNDITKEFAASMESFKNTVDEIKNVKLFDPTIINQFNEITTTLNSIAGVVHKSAEYSVILRQQLEAIQKLGEQINKLKIDLPDEKPLKELQMTAHFISETLKIMSEANATKSLENLAYIAGKRAGNNLQ